MNGFSLGSKKVPKSGTGPSGVKTMATMSKGVAGMMSQWSTVRKVNMQTVPSAAGFVSSIELSNCRGDLLCLRYSTHVVSLPALSEGY